MAEQLVTSVAGDAQLLEVAEQGPPGPPGRDAIQRSSAISGMTYDGSGRLTGYMRLGAQHTVSYPTATTMVITNSTGEQRTVTFDGAGRVTAIA